jgi:hypothetical protein
MKCITIHNVDRIIEYRVIRKNSLNLIIELLPNIEVRKIYQQVILNNNLEHISYFYQLRIMMQILLNLIIQ